MIRVDEVLFENTQLAAYFLWEQTHLENTLELWRCAEDIACFFEQSDILSARELESIISLDVNDFGYIEFVRHIAYRIYLYTGKCDALYNWLTAERLLGNNEWRQALVYMASYYNKQKKTAGGLSSVCFGHAKNFYGIGSPETDNLSPEA